MILESLFVAFSVAGAGDDLSCRWTQHMPGYFADDVVVVIDGEVRSVPVPEDEQDEIDRSTLELRCWNPETDEFPAANGIKLILAVSFEHRKGAEAEALRVARLVQSHVSEHGALPASLEALGPAASGFTLETFEDGWKITAPDTGALVCSVVQSGGTADHVVQCGQNYDLIRQNLRAVYERGAQPNL